MQAHNLSLQYENAGWVHFLRSLVQYHNKTHGCGSIKFQDQSKPEIVNNISFMEKPRLKIRFYFLS